MKNLGIVIQARMGSTRLPGKVLMDFCGKPMLKYQIDRITKFNIDSKVVVATSENHLDDKIEDFCIKNKILYIRGSEENVFNRFQKVAEEYRFNHIVRLTGDNPLTEFKIIDACIKKHLKTHPDLTSTRKILFNNTVQRFVPKGYSVDVINCKSLLDINSNDLNSFQKEHVIPIFYNGNYKISYVKEFIDLNQSVSIDTIEDLEKVKQYMKLKYSHDK